MNTMAAEIMHAFKEKTDVQDTHGYVFIFKF